MIYSVFDWDTGRYRYYEGDGEGLGIRPRSRHILHDANGKGHQLEELMPTLPINARFITEGDEPRGRLAVTNDTAVDAFGATGAGGDNPLLTAPWWVLGVWTGVMLLSFKFATWAGQQVMKRGA